MLGVHVLLLQILPAGKLTGLISFPTSIRVGQGLHHSMSCRHLESMSFCVTQRRTPCLLMTGSLIPERNERPKETQSRTELHSCLCWWCRTLLVEFAWHARSPRFNHKHCIHCVDVNDADSSPQEVDAMLQKFQAIINYMTSSRLAWATTDPVPKEILNPFKPRIEALLKEP